MVFGAFECGALLRVWVGFGCAELVGGGGVVVERGEQGVGGLVVVVGGGGDEDEFGVGRRGGVGEPVQVFGAEVVGVVDDDQAAQRKFQGRLAQCGAGAVDVAAGVGVGVLGGVVAGCRAGGQGEHALVVVVCGSHQRGQGTVLVGAGVQVQCLHGVDVGGNRGNDAAVGVVKIGHCGLGWVVEGSGADGAGGLQEGDLGA